jgi:histidine triad (HIT) family protein
MAGQGSGGKTMDLDGDYDPNNIFAKIVRGEMPAAKVFEDADTLAFMDVFPQCKGHTLVIHKHAAARNLLDIEPGPLQALILTVQRVTLAVRTALAPDGIMISQFNGAASGQTVYHLHFHIMPRWQGQALGRHASGGMADPKELAQIAAQIAAKIA